MTAAVTAPGNITYDCVITQIGALEIVDFHGYSRKSIYQYGTAVEYHDEHEHETCDQSFAYTEDFQFYISFLAVGLK